MLNFISSFFKSTSQVPSPAAQDQGALKRQKKALETQPLVAPPSSSIFSGLFNRSTY